MLDPLPNWCAFKTYGLTNDIDFQIDFTFKLSPVELKVFFKNCSNSYSTFDILKPGLIFLTVTDTTVHFSKCKKITNILEV